MTVITAKLQVHTIEELKERQRVARRILVGSVSFTVLIATIGGLLAVIS